MKREHWASLRKSVIEQNRKARTKLSNVCPVCGLTAQIVFYDETKRVWVYKHPQIYRGSRQIIRETIYHQVAA